MFGKKSKEIARLVGELDELKKAHANAVTNATNSAEELGKRTLALDNSNCQIGKLNESLAAKDREITRLNELSKKYETEIFTARHGEDPETNAFYAAKITASKAESEKEDGEEPAAENKKEPREATEQMAQAVAVNTGSKRQKDRRRR